jgi:hypothetical protein
MKTLALSFLVLAASIPLQADEQLKNPDFTDGRSHWEGDGESVAASDNTDLAPSLTQNNVTSATGLLLKLSSRDWVKITQDFRPLAAAGTLTVVYTLSDGLAFSSDFDDYKSVPQKIDYSNFQPFDILAGNWILTLFESADTQLKYYAITPKPNASAQTFKTRIEGLVVREDKTLCLAFPPGHGTITLLHVGLSDQ